MTKELNPNPDHEEGGAEGLSGVPVCLDARGGAQGQGSSETNCIAGIGWPEAEPPTLLLKFNSYFCCSPRPEMTNKSL